MTPLPTLVAEPPKETASGSSKPKTAPGLLQLYSSLEYKHKQLWLELLKSSRLVSLPLHSLDKFRLILNLQLQQNLQLIRHKMDCH
jgi:hypothetical protein